jgi:hypothetical protein
MIHLPKSWSDVSVEQYIELMQLEYSDIFTMQIERIALFADIPIEDLDDYSIEEIKQLNNRIKWSYSEPSHNYKTELNEYRLKPFNTLTLGEYIDIEHFLGQGVYDNLTKLFAIMYRKHKVDEWSNTKFEPYDYDIFERCDTFLPMPIESVYGVFKEWVSFKENIQSTYSNLLDTAISDEEVEQADEEDKEDLQKEKQLQTMGWEFVLDNLTDNDITKMNAVLELPFILVMNTLSRRQSTKS